MRTWALLAVLLAVAAVAQGQATSQETPVTVVRVVARPVLIRPAEILGRKFGPFGSDDEPVDSPHAAMWRAVEDQLSEIATLHDRIAAAMAIRCPRLRQRALELALASSMGPAAVETQEEASDAAVGTWATVMDEEDEEEASEWPENEDDEEDDDDKYDDDDDDDDDEEEEEEDDDMPRGWSGKMGGGMMMAHHHHSDKMMRHGFHHDHHERMHEWMHAHAHGHEHPEHRPDGPFPFFHHHQHHHQDTAAGMGGIMPRPMMPMGGRSEPWRGMGPASTAVPEDDATNWALWNEDGSLNGGLILFALLCAACAAVWSALLLQCAAFHWDRVCGAARRGQFVYSAVPWAFETSSDDEEDDDPKAALKKEQARVVYAADFVGKA